MTSDQHSNQSRAGCTTKTQRTRCSLSTFASHGISEGVAWNHFSVPGNFVYGTPLDELDVQAMAAHTLYAGDLADELDKLKIPYILLPDSLGQFSLFPVTRLNPAGD